MTAFDALSPVGPHVRTIVAMPARNEARRIERALEALVAQRDADGTAFDPGAYETIVFANGCDDGTARLARAFAASPRGAAHAIYVVEAPLGLAAHVGSARRLVMDAACDRLTRAGRNDGWIVSTDADSVVDARWLASLDDEIANGADAVMGAVGIAAADRSVFAPHAARLYAWYLAYGRARARVRARLDPLAWDPSPHHDTRSAANLAVRVDAYVRAGGLPERACGEDAAFYDALLAIDARVRHSPHVRVATSPRAEGRVAGGFSKLVSDLHDASGPEQWLVEDPEITLGRIRAGAALRAYHRDRTSVLAYRDVLASYAIDFAGFAALYDSAGTFGANLLRFERDAARRGIFSHYGCVPVVRAVTTLREVCAAADSRSAARETVASGAG